MMIQRLLVLAAIAFTAWGQNSVEAYNVVWTSPSKDSSGSMPVGNGDIGANVWVEESGDVVLYVSKSDAWDDNGRLLKLGRVRLRLNPNPFAAGQPFRQTLNLRNGEVILEGGKPGSQAKISLWVETFTPVLRIESEMQTPTEIQAIYERWRDQPRVLDGDEAQSAYGLHDGPEPVRSFGDSISLDAENSIIWYHRNTKTVWPSIMKLQGLSEFKLSMPDPLRDRTFGASMSGEGFARINPTMLRSKTPTQKASLSIFTLTQQTNSSEEWISEMRNLITQTSVSKPEDRRTAHDKYWQEFWDKSYIRVTGNASAEAVTQGYALQRYLNALAGRGAFPIKPNGSLFTVDAKVNDFSYDADYRRLGAPYSLASTLQVYWPMLASGDADLMTPLFKMYRESLVLATQRTKSYFNHDGGFLPETMYFWGAYPNSDYGWSREGKPASYVNNPAIRNYFTNNLTLLSLMLDYAAYFPQDRNFRMTYIAPMAEAMVQFYDLHFEHAADGRVQISPSQALDTYLEATNPLPDIAGLKYVLNRLQAEKIPMGKPGQNSLKRLLTQLPELPTHDVAGKKVLAPAERVFGEAKNSDNPELYAVFPFRIYGMQKPDIEIAQETFQARKNKQSPGSRMDAIQAAYLGFGTFARDYVVENFTAKSDQRFPAFWGPNSQSTPDQTTGAVAATALQSMILQADGNRLIVAPAWPKDWDCEFKLHGPNATVVEGAIRGGKIERLKTTPDKRISDVVRMEPDSPGASQ